MKWPAIPAARVRRIGLAVGSAATVAAVVAGIAAPAGFFAAWLFAWLCVLAIALGALANVMIHELTGGEWGFVIRPALESALGTLPIVGLLGIPLLFGLPHLYPWAAAHPGDALLAAKSWYLNTPFFTLRAIACFIVWSALAFALRRQWRLRRTNAAGAPQPDLRALSIAGLIVYALTMTLAATDWIMSLSRDWYSTGFGLFVLISQALVAFAFAVAASVASGALAGAPSTHARIPADAMSEAPSVARDAQDLGNILLMYVMMWAYLAFTQFLIIWAEDLPSEIGWYVMRSTRGWKALAIVIFLLLFVLPFAAMLFRRFKRDPARLGVLCAIVVVGCVLQFAWQVLPPFAAEPMGFALLALAGVGGLWAAAFATLHAKSVPFARAGTRRSSMAERPAAAMQHEPNAVDARRICVAAGGLVGVIALCIVASLLLVPAYAHVYKRAPARAAQALPATRGVPLQPDPEADLAHFRAEKQALLEGYAWVDRPQGIARIPIEDAMRIIAQHNGNGSSGGAR